MSSTHQIERNRGTKDARQQLAVLREKWPLAFPAKPEDVRRSAPPARSLRQWVGRLRTRSACLSAGKWRQPYCQAVLCYDKRVSLDGSPAETIEAEPKELATKQLARLAAREIAKKSVKAAAPAVVEPKPDHLPPTVAPDQLCGRVRASLLRRRA